MYNIGCLANQSHLFLAMKKPTMIVSDSESIHNVIVKTLNILSLEHLSMNRVSVFILYFFSVLKRVIYGLC